MSVRGSTSSWCRAALLSCLALGAALAAPDEPLVEFKKSWARAQDATARSAALRRLGERPSPEVARTLAKVALDGQVEWATREVAIGALTAIGAPEVVRWAGEAVAGAEKDPSVRAVLCDYLGARAVHDPAVAASILPALSDEHAPVQLAAIRGLARTRTPETVEALLRLLERPATQGRVQGDCLRALRGLTGERFGTALEWRSWWTANREGFTVPPPPDPERPSGRDAQGEEMRTVTRLDPPGKAHESIYGGIDSNRVLFVVDNSGSMRVKVLAGDGSNPTRLDYVKEALAKAIETQLEDGDQFNVVCFSTEPKPWKKKLVEASAGNVREAVRWVRGLQLEGETNIHDTLELAFRHPNVDTIYFLTDGNATTGKTTIPDEILGAVKAWNTGRGVRVCTIGFFAGDASIFNVVEDKGMSERFLRALAQQNGGTFTFFE
jgi:hypothetical protein